MSERVLIRTVVWDAQRFDWALDLAEAVDDGRLVVDEGRSAYGNFLRALRIQSQESRGAWHLEDDVVLTSNWREKAAVALSEAPGAVVQAYSDRRLDLTDGSRWMAGSSFLMAQCFYVPAELAYPLWFHCSHWPGREEHPNGLDMAVASFLKDYKKRYWLHVPSLVQHRIAKSVIDPRRSSKRQSRSFVA